MVMVQAVDLSMNDLNGSVPSQLGSCVALEFLNLSGNHLEGILPVEIGQLPSLQVLEVSMNQLTGQIPESLQASSTLRQLNLSFNDFSGYVASTGAFSNMSIDSFLGNYDLCGSIKGMHGCGKSFRSLLRAILVPLFPAPILCLLGYWLRNRSKQIDELEDEGMDDQSQERTEPSYPRISHRELIEATGGFDSSSLIGSGQYGRVYKGLLRNNTRVAVKVLDSKATRDVSFKRECQVLKKARHRNLIRVVSVCSEADFKAIVFPLMLNGSLERFLYPCHGQSGDGLDLVQLISICSDVAAGIAYLHHHAPVRIVHCDLKPSNILLDDDMSALVADFGISRLSNGGEKHTNSNTFSSTNGFLCCSVGYIPPEYGLGKGASPEGDVYSFGILLLEIVSSGKRPTDVLFDEGSDLHEWANNLYPDKLDRIIGQSLLRCARHGKTLTTDQMCHDAILELIEIGLMCTRYSPSTRPSMLDMAHEMGRLKKFISVSDLSAVIEVGDTQALDSNV
ncbi:putative leucine-rich repeat receptor-like serine/threonine-protein kinase [Drosera capensis]